MLRTSVFGIRILIVATAVLIAGCEDPPPPDIGSETGSTGSGCADMLKRSLEGLEPGRLGISSSAAESVSSLNSWLEKCAEPIETDSAAAPDIRERLQAVLSPEEMNRLSAERFNADDGRHVRNCLLHKAIANQDFASSETEFGLAVELFHYVTRNVVLPQTPQEALPLPPYEILLFGRGSPEDAAWVFADLLRQLKIDAVILRPVNDAADRETGPIGRRRWLIGVLLSEDVYLFDPQLGSPIPSLLETGQASPTVEQPATLAEALKDDRVLRQLDIPGEEPYPLTSGDLQRLKVEVIGTSSFWTSRAQRLQAALSGDRSAVVSDPLADDADTPGLITRVAESSGGHWHTEDVGIWPYPQAQLKAFENLGETEHDRLSLLHLPLGAPVLFQFDPATGQFIEGKPENRQIKTRIQQLLGDYRTAIGNFQRIRLSIISIKFPPQPEIQLMHARAEEDALFWIGLCQFEQGKFHEAAATFGRYQQRYSKQEGASWLAHCQNMLALSHAEAGDLDEALFILEEPEPPAHLRERNRFWTHRWETQQKLSNE